MSKAEIVTEIAKTTGIDKASVLSAVEQFMTFVKDSLAHGENVYLRGFGSLIVKLRADKIPVTSARTRHSSFRLITSRRSNLPRPSWRRLPRTDMEEQNECEDANFGNLHSQSLTYVCAEC